MESWAGADEVGRCGPQATQVSQLHTRGIPDMSRRPSFFTPHRVADLGGRADTRCQAEQEAESGPRTLTLHSPLLGCA